MEYNIHLPEKYLGEVWVLKKNKRNFTEKTLVEDAYMWYTCFRVIGGSANIRTCALPSVGKQALKLCALELTRLKFWVTDCAGELWAFPEGKRWYISVRLKAYGKARAPHAVLETWSSPQGKGKRRGQGNTCKIPRESQSLLLSRAGLRGTGRSMQSLGDMTFHPNPVVRFHKVYRHESNNSIASYVLLSLLPLHTEKLRLGEISNASKVQEQKEIHLRIEPRPVQCLRPVLFTTEWYYLTACLH